MILPSSHRVLPLVEPFEKLLRRLKEEQERNQKVCGSAYCREYLGYIYVNELGERIKPGYVTQNFSLTLKNHGLKKTVSTICVIAAQVCSMPTESA